MPKRDRASKRDIRFDDENLAPWERQPREGDKAWQCFLTYRNLPYENPPVHRSQREVSSRLYPGRSPSEGRVREIADWSARWSWRARVEAYDRHVDGEQREAFAAALRRDAELNIAAYRTMRNRGSQKLLTLAIENIAPALAVKMVDTGITGLRREAGLATEITGSEKDDAFVAWLTAGEDDEEGEGDGR